MTSSEMTSSEMTSFEAVERKDEATSRCPRGVGGDGVLGKRNEGLGKRRRKEPTREARCVTWRPSRPISWYFPDDPLHCASIRGPEATPTTPGAVESWECVEEVETEVELVSTGAGGGRREVRCTCGSSLDEGFMIQVLQLPLVLCLPWCSVYPWCSIYTYCSTYPWCSSCPWCSRYSQWSNSRGVSCWQAAANEGPLPSGHVIKQLAVHSNSSYEDSMPVTTLTHSRTIVSTPLSSSGSLIGAQTSSAGSQTPQVGSTHAIAEMVTLNEFADAFLKGDVTNWYPTYGFIGPH
eukprot:Em0438g6a